MKPRRDYGDGRRIQNHPSTYDSFGNAWSFYYAPELRLALFYCDSEPLHFAPRQRLKVYCAALDEDALLEFLGTGDEGFAEIDKRVLALQCLVPVNLWNGARVIDPRPSRTFHEDEHDDYLAYVASVRRFV